MAPAFLFSKPVNFRVARSFLAFARFRREALTRHRAVQRLKPLPHCGDGANDDVGLRGRNSCSPNSVNARGRLVGLASDGN